MCAAWNHASYQELERLLPELRSEQPALAWHLRATYFAPRRRVLVCPRCDGRAAMWSSVSFHKHNGMNITLVPRVLRVVPLGVRAEPVAEAIAWLDERWRGGVFVPDELLRLVTAA